jgi:hypothetical protein
VRNLTFSLCLIGILLIPFLAIYVSAQNTPKASGVYLQDGNGWQSLELVSIMGSRASGVAKAAFSYGIATAKIVLLYRNGKAPVATSDTRPTFCIVNPAKAQPRDIVIVRLKQKKDHRELQVAKLRTFAGPDMEYDPKDTFGVTVGQSGSCEMATSSIDLKPGQYVLFPGNTLTGNLPSGYGGYDFGISKP